MKKVIIVKSCHECPYTSGWDPNDCPQPKDYRNGMYEALFCAFGRMAFPWHGGKHDSNDKKIGCFNRAKVEGDGVQREIINFPGWCPLNNYEV